MKILVTGGAGYIGSHTVLQLKEAGHTTVVYDNLSKGREELIFSDHFVKGDLSDRTLLVGTMREHGIEAVLHFAAFIEAGESMENPAKYFQNNTEGSFRLLESMREAGVKLLIFSSTAALYGFPESTPIEENAPLVPANPYGESKLLVERILRWYSEIYNFRYVSLRYFNAAGADPLLRTGENHEPETHLIPIALRAAYGMRDRMFINGTDYPTKDGTCVRDFIHVSDLARAHLMSLDYLANGGRSEVFNLGSQKGYSVREVLEMVKHVTGQDFIVQEGPRRPGDPDNLVASSEKIRRILGWEPEFDELEFIVESAANYFRKRMGIAE